MLSFVPSCPCRVRGRNPAWSLFDLSFGTALSVPTPEAQRVLFAPPVGAVSSLLCQPLSHPSFSPARASTRGVGSSWAEEEPAEGCPGRGKGKGLPSSCRELGRCGWSGWPVLSFPTQGELSVPCCLLSICNRCKYLLLIYSLKELQNSVCVCELCAAGGAGCAACSSPAAQPR